MPITPEDFSEASLAAWLAAGGEPVANTISAITEDPTPPEYANAVSSVLQGAYMRLKQCSRVLDKASAAANQSPTSLTDIYSYNIVAGTLAAGDIVRLTFNGIYFNNDGGTRNPTFACLLGGNILWSDNSVSLAVSASILRTIKIVVDMIYVDESTQYITGQISIGNIAAATTGNGDLATSNAVTSSFNASILTLDMSGDDAAFALQTNLITVSNAANHYIARRSAYVEKL